MDGMENVKIVMILTSDIWDGQDGKVRATLYLIGKGFDQNSNLTDVAGQNVLPNSLWHIKLLYKKAFLKDFIV
jgi:hypothetical protein